MAPRYAATGRVFTHPLDSCRRIYHDRLICETERDSGWNQGIRLCDVRAVRKTGSNAVTGPQRD